MTTSPPSRSVQMNEDDEGGECGEDDEDDGPWIDEPILFLDQFQLPQELFGSGCLRLNTNRILNLVYSNSNNFQKALYKDIKAAML